MLGALDLYRTTPGELDPGDMATAQTLADVATAYLLNAEARVTRNEFVATVSHELRTPITNIAGYVEFLEDEVEGPLTPGQTDFVAAIGRNSWRLIALVNDLLTVSSLEAGNESRPQRGAGPGRRGPRRAAHPATALDRRSSGSSPSRSPDEPVLVVGDPTDLEAVVLNLMSNALKFTSTAAGSAASVRQVGLTAGSR